MKQYEMLKIGQIVEDSMGCEWIDREKIPGGAKLQINKEGGPFITATPATCTLDFYPVLQCYELTLESGEKLCIIGTRQPTLEEATAFAQKSYTSVVGTKAVSEVKSLFFKEAAGSCDLSTVRSWPVFGIPKDAWPVEGRRIWSKERKVSGIVTKESRRYCSACQCIHDCYVVSWTDGMRTKPCTAGVELLDNGELHIV